MKRRRSSPSGVLLVVAALLVLGAPQQSTIAAAASVNLTFFEGVFKFEDGSQLQENRRWVLSLFTTTNETQIGAQSCANVTTSPRYYCAQWLPDTSACAVVFDQILPPSVIDIRAGGIIAIRYRSSFSGSRLNVTITCEEGAPLRPDFGSTPFTGSRAPGGEEAITAHSSALCLAPTNSPSSNSSGGDGGGSTEGNLGLIIGLVVGLFVLLLVLVALVIACKPRINAYLQQKSE